MRNAETLREISGETPEEIPCEEFPKELLDKYSLGIPGETLRGFFGKTPGIRGKRRTKTYQTSRGLPGGPLEAFYHGP